MREICPHPPRSTLMRASWDSSARELLGGEEHRAAGRKLRPPLKGEIRLAAAMRDEAAEVRGPGGGAERSGPFASPIRRMGIAGDVGTMAGLLLVHESY